MKKIRRKKIKKFNLNPATRILILILLVAVVTSILSLFSFGGSYQSLDVLTNEYKTTTIYIRNFFSKSGLEHFFSNTVSGFAGFYPFVSLAIILISVSIMEFSGLIDKLSDRYFKKLNDSVLTFFVLFIGLLGTIIDNSGYAILIPITALIYKKTGRNPLLGIVTSFIGLGFGNAITIFASSKDVLLRANTFLNSRIFIKDVHVPLMSNIIISIFTSVVFLFFATFIIEKIIKKKIKKYEDKSESENIRELTEQEKIEKEYYEKRGLKYFQITAIVLFFLIIYMIVPGLFGSGILLNNTKNTYLLKLFGTPSYFKNSWIFILLIFFSLTSIAYSIGAKKISKGTNFYKEIMNNFRESGSILIFFFLFSILISIYNYSNLGIVVSANLSEMLRNINLSGTMLIIFSFIVLLLSGLFYPSYINRWTIFSPVIIEKMILSNMSPSFGQFIYRASDSISRGFTLFMPFFVIYYCYLNFYNSDEKHVSFKSAISYLFPMFLAGILLLLVILLVWYSLGLPLGSGVNPTL